jgi:YHS domain-containing protein
MRSLFFYLSFLLLPGINAQNSNSLSKQLNTKNNIAVSGYDVVAYFTQQEAIKGNKQYSVSHQGVIYYFSTENNKNIFIKSTTSFEPQYGGWCAYAMGAKGSKVDVDPETFKIINGKLYLFYNKYLTNTLTLWNKDENNLKSKADANWKAILSK